MPLQIPTVRDLEKRVQLNVAGEFVPLTDFTPIAVVRQLIRLGFLEPIASLWRGLKQASDLDYFLDTARGDNLRRRLRDFKFLPPGAVSAYGTVQFQVSELVSIPQGTLVRTQPEDGSAPRRYQVSTNPDRQDGQWVVDPQVPGQDSVPVQALDQGQQGNTGAFTITQMEAQIQGVQAVTNVLPISNGRDQPTDDETRQLFLDYLDSLRAGSRGSILWGVRYVRDNNTGQVGYLTDSQGRRVHSVAVQEWDGRQLLNSQGEQVAMIVWIDEATAVGTDNAACASPSLVGTVQSTIDGTDDQDSPGLRAAGVPCQVRAARALSIGFEGHVDFDHQANVVQGIEQVKNAILSHVAQLPVGGLTVLGERQGDFVFDYMFRRVLDVPQVLRATFASPPGDIAVPTGYKAVVGSLNISGGAI